MPHGGYGKSRVAGRKPSSSQRPKASGGVTKKPKPKPKFASLKNQIRSTERLLRKDLPSQMREAQQRKLEELKNQQDLHNRLAVERQLFLRDRKVKFFERRKIERGIRRLEKHQRSSSGQAQETETAEELAKLKEDLEYVRFFPKTERYVSLFTGGDNEELVERRDKLRKQIKANLIAAAASGKDLEETGSEDDGLIELSDDDFFVSGTSSDEADADDELTDISAREQASSASGLAASSMSSDERNQKQIAARSLMPPPRPKKSSTSRTNFRTSRNPLNNRNMSNSNERGRSNLNNRNISVSNERGHSNTNNRNMSVSNEREHSNTNNRNMSEYNGREHSNLNNRNMSQSNERGRSNSQTGQSSNISSNSDAPKRKRKRRPKKKK